MDMYTPAPRPRIMTFSRPSSPFTETVTRIGPKAFLGDHGDLAALIGGVVAAVLLVLICMLAVLMWCLSRHKGSYVTNETDDDDEDDNADDESVGSGTALRSREPLKAKEDE